ncbi:MAG: YjfB family protein [Lachnospiraceae bacterium]|nr:YjfB family protein [Lachnospiraceae bacterium]
MDIPSLSIGMAQNDLMNKVNIELLTKSIDNAEETSEAMIKMMETSVNPNVGSNFDVRV